MSDSHLIVALDVRTLDEVKTLVNELADSVSFYKVGMELYYSAGPCVIEYLKEQNKQIFLDLKLHDIPNTVAEGLCSLMRLGVSLFNIHASGGYTMMKTASDKIHAEAENLGIQAPKLIAVTILTSMNDQDWKEMGNTDEIADRVVRLAKLAKKARMDGVVASPQEAAMIREACGNDFLIVTPGVRPQGAAINDQNRIATPAAALRNGATHLVVGRPIRAAENPRQAALDILKEMESVAK